MVSVSNDFKTSYKQTTRNIMALVGVDGVVNGVTEQYLLSDTDIIEMSFDYPFSTNNYPTYGQVYSATMRIHVKSDIIPASFWTDAEDVFFYPSLMARVGTPPLPEYCDLGRFKMRSRKSSDNFATYEIEAMDYAADLDVPLPTTWDDNAYTGNINPWLYYADTVVSNILTACGLTIDPNFTFPTDSQGNRMKILNLEGNWLPENITARQALGYIGGLWGANGMMTRDGYFTFKSYAKYPLTIDSVPLDMQYMGGLIRDREDPQYTYSGFYHAGEGVTNPTGVTPTDYDGVVYLISDGLITDWGGTGFTPPTWTEAKDTFVYYSNQFATDYSGFYFVGGDMTYRGMPWLECGDVINVQYEYNGTIYTSLFMISHHTLKVTGGLSGTMRCYTPMIAEVEDESSASSAFGGAVTESVNLGKSHPVGSVVVTNTNTDPADLLKFGTWTLIDKEFKSQSRTATVSRNTTNFSALSVTAVYDGHSITFIGTMTSSVSISGTNLEVLTQTLTDNGASALANTVPFIGYSDGAHAAVLMDIDTAGRVRTMDVVVRGTATSIASGSSITWSVTCPCLYTAMQDSYCDKFYWKRTA